MKKLLPIVMTVFVAGQVQADGFSLELQPNGTMKHKSHEERLREAKETGSKTGFQSGIICVVASVVGSAVARSAGCTPTGTLAAGIGLELVTIGGLWTLLRGPRAADIRQRLGEQYIAAADLEAGTPAIIGALAGVAASALVSQGAGQGAGRVGFGGARG